MTNVQTVKLSQLIPDALISSRLSGHEEDIGELAENIKAVGLILPLSVRPLTGGSSFTIIDGHRRHQALMMIHSGKEEETDVPVLVRDADDKDARVLSLAANIMRLPLHPADQYEAFKAMLDEGISREEVASRFSLSLKDVDQRLALGRVIKPFLNQYRTGDLTLDGMKALSSVHPERQQAILVALNAAGGRVSDWKVREFINEDAVYSSHPIARFVGLERYAQAGGRIETSMFDTDERLIDVHLLHELAEKRVPGFIEEMEANGWKWVRREADMPKGWSNWKRHYPETKYSPEVQAELDATDKRLDELSEIDGDEWNDVLEEEQDRITERQHELRHSGVPGFAPEEMAGSGIVIGEDYRLTMGMVWPTDKAIPEEGARPEKPEVKGWSQKLVDDVESHGTVAVQLAIMREPVIADAMLLAGLYQDCVSTSTSRPLAISSPDRFSDVEINAGKDIQSALKGFGLKGTEFWSLVKQIRLMHPMFQAELRAVLTARMLKKRRGKELEDALDYLETVNVLASFKPDKEFFERLTTQQLVEIHKEITGTGLIEGIKKSDAVSVVATKAAAANWLPKVLRKGAPEMVLPSPKKKTAEKGDVITTVVGEDGKTASVKRKRAA